MQEHKNKQIAAYMVHKHDQKYMSSFYNIFWAYMAYGHLCLASSCGTLAAYIACYSRDDDQYYAPS